MKKGKLCMKFVKNIGRKKGGKLMKGDGESKEEVYEGRRNGVKAERKVNISV